MAILAQLRRDITFVLATMRVLRKVRKLKPQSPVTTADVIEKYARKTPHAPAIYYRDQIFTFQDYDQWANRYARWAQGQGLKRGEVVALMMENRPEYLFAWLGLAKIGVIASLVNTNVTGKSLAHVLKISGARHLILGSELAAQYAEGARHLEKTPEVWTTGGRVENTNDLDGALKALAQTSLPTNVRNGMTAGDKCFYIYTSGTTGLPKAANISHMRVLSAFHAFAGAANARPSDRMYIVLPLYHSTGGMAAIGATLSVGGSIILRRSFSASAFWDDVVNYRATMFQYVGELCRYLLNGEPHPLERSHQLRLAMGNGLRPEIWRAFQSRFRIPKIIEFYASTEGNVALFNLDGKPGAVGRVPPFLKGSFNIDLIRFDVEGEKPIRGEDGFCFRTSVGEVGEAVGHIHEEARGRFEGYSDSGASQKKILRDVFTKGDMWFQTGDLMRRDEHGYYYFVDRIGDTFRWKGENVATSEVAQVMATVNGIKEANVYGVKVPGAEGRVGMAALVSDETLDLDALHRTLEENLPFFARPAFIRLRKDMEITGTFKHRKVELVEQGFDPAAISEPLYFNDVHAKRFVPLTEDLYRHILNGEVRF